MAAIVAGQPPAHWDSLLRRCTGTLGVSIHASRTPPAFVPRSHQRCSHRPLLQRQCLVRGLEDEALG